MKTKFTLSVICLCMIIFLYSCSGVKDAVTNAQRLQFKLGSVDNFNMAGVNISKIKSLNDVNLIDGAVLLAAFAGGSMPASFDVNLIAKNPDTYPGGSKESSSLIKSVSWRLLIDGQEMVGGEVDKNIIIPGVGQSVTIPIPVKLDLAKLMSDGGYEKIMNLALAIGGKSGSSSRLTLKIRPVADIFMGEIFSPGEIDVINKEFR
ncbi:MAG: hypothetical protein KBF96_02050 [Ignavibacteria bacterium]|jgi:hypothetical protein|nr:hypothetical protein [Ignavibacteria bacterium]